MIKQSTPSGPTLEINKYKQARDMDSISPIEYSFGWLSIRRAYEGECSNIVNTSLVQFLKKHVGRQSFCLNIDYRRYWVWVQKHKNVTFYILTSPSSGYIKTNILHIPSSSRYCKYCRRYSGSFGDYRYKGRVTDTTVIFDFMDGLFTFIKDNHGWSYDRNKKWEKQRLGAWR